MEETNLTEEEIAQREAEILAAKLRDDEKNAEITDALSEFPDIDVNQVLAAWGLKVIQNNHLGTDTDLILLKDQLNKISECNVAIYNYFKDPTDYNRDLLRNTLLNWTKKEPTNLDFKAKYR
jgi:hypothetical protein